MTPASAPKGVAKLVALSAAIRAAGLAARVGRTADGRRHLTGPPLYALSVAGWVTTGAESTSRSPPSLRSPSEATT